MKIFKKKANAEQAEPEVKAEVTEPKKSKKGLVGFIVGIASAIFAGILMVIFGNKAAEKFKDSGDSTEPDASDSTESESPTTDD